MYTTPSAPPGTPIVIDASAQHPTTRHLAGAVFEPLHRWAKGAMPRAEVPVAATLAAMDEGGVHQSLISAWAAPRNVMVSNDEVASLVSASEGRLIGVGSVDLSKPMPAVREARRCVTELGFKAIRVLPWLWEVPPTDRRFYPVYAACCELGVPFCTRIGHTSPLMPSEVGRPIYLDPVALDFPELRIVAGHIGYPWIEEAIAMATTHENVFIDTSAHMVRRCPGELLTYLRGQGRDKVMFGTNYPMLTPATALAGVEELGLGADVLSRFLGGNAARVFGLSLPHHHS